MSEHVRITERELEAALDLVEKGARNISAREAQDWRPGTPSRTIIDLVAEVRRLRGIIAGFSQARAVEFHAEVAAIRAEAEGAAT